MVNRHSNVLPVTIEKYIDGQFEKIINNDGVVCCLDEQLRRKEEAFVHFTWKKSDDNFMIMDLQGVQYQICDPEIVTLKIVDDSDFFSCFL